MKHLFILHVFLFVMISNTSAQVWVKPTGRVGIGDIDPIAKLQVNSTSTFANPGIAILDSSASETQGGILQFRSVTWDDNHFNLRGSLSQYSSGLDSKFDLFFRENLLMSITATSLTNRHLLYHSAYGALRAGYHSIGSIGEYSIAAGYNNTASGTSSTAFGGGNQATGQFSTVLGGGSIASESYSSAIGYDNNASGPFSLAVGRRGLASGVAAIAMGDSTSAFGRSSFATGYKTLASGDYSSATGAQTTASGLYSLAGGFATTASNTSSMAFGFVSQATGVSATALGYSTLAAGENSVAINSVTKALGPNSFTSGLTTKTNGWMSSAFGESTTARSYASAVFGRFNDTISTGNPDYWINEDPLFMIGNGSGHSERNNALTIYKNGNILAKHPTAVISDPGALSPPVSGTGTRLMWLPEKSAFRVGTVNGDRWDAASIGLHSFAGGLEAMASGNASVAFGAGTTASGVAAFASGGSTIASGGWSTAMGVGSKATHLGATALGADCQALNIATVAIGGESIASGEYAAAIGLGLKAKAYASMAIGAYNDSIATSLESAWVDTDPLLMVGNGTSAASRHNAFTVYKNGDLLAKHPSTIIYGFSSDALPESGSGTRMMWIPGKSAFRVGTVWSNQWDEANTGGWSFASGLNTQASGEASTAMGVGASASGLHAIALGFGVEAFGEKSFAVGLNTEASGYASTAMGENTQATGEYATAMGFYTQATSSKSFASGNYTNATGSSSTAMGYLSTASGPQSTALGNNSMSSGEISTAMGYGSDASGYVSTAIGNATVAPADFSTSIGFYTIAKAMTSVAIGAYNDTIAGSSEVSWVETDPLFYIGNGSSYNDRSNAMVIYKNANTDISGYTRIGTESEDAPRIKMKQLTGSTGSDYNSSSSITHGLEAEKILAVDVLVQWGVDLFAPPEYSASLDLRYNYYVNASAIVIQNNTPSGDCQICEKYVKILITYQE